MRPSPAITLPLGALVCLVALTLRAATALNPYSGEHDAPHYGDFEAQRHWMEITNALPVRDWYRDVPGNNLTYWGLDYPPLSAYASLVSGAILGRIEPAAVALNTSHGYESEESRALMRASVIASDMFVFFPAVVWFLADEARGLEVLVFVLSLPALIIIDHGHFQYNNASLGLFIASLAAFRRNRHALGASLFSLAVYFKQMSLYYAPAIAFYLLSTMVSHDTLRQAAFYALRIALAILSTFVLIFLPWLPDDIPHILARLFPFTRGLFEDKVANFWCTISLLHKLRLPTKTLLALCSGTTVFASAPFYIAVARRPSTRQLSISASGCALAAFLFSYQVHEKHVLIPLAPLALLVDTLPLTAFWASLVATFSLYPLLERDGLATPYIALIILHAMAYDEIFWRRRESRLSVEVAAPRWAVGAAFGVAAVLHALHAFGPAVASKPDLYVVFITSYACAHLCLIYIALVYYSFKIPGEAGGNRKLADKIR